MLIEHKVRKERAEGKGTADDGWCVEGECVCRGEVKRTLDGSVESRK